MRQERCTTLGVGVPAPSFEGFSSRAYPCFARVSREPMSHSIRKKLYNVHKFNQSLHDLLLPTWTGD